MFIVYIGILFKPYNIVVSDINECSDSTLNTCDANALCINSPPGTYVCACKSGFTDNTTDNSGRSCIGEPVSIY